LPRASRSLACRRVKRQFLDAPVEPLRGIDRIFRRARQLVDPPELARSVTGFAEIPEHLSIEREFVNPPGIRVGAIQILRSRTRRDADCPWCAFLTVNGLLVRHVAHPRMDPRRHRNVDVNLLLEVSIRVEDLDTAVSAIG